MRGAGGESEGYCRDRIKNRKRMRGIFEGVVALAVPGGVHQARVEVWKRKILQMGGRVTDQWEPSVTHVLAASSQLAVKHLKSKTRGSGSKESIRDAAKATFLRWEWVQDSLIKGSLIPTGPYLLSPPPPPGQEDKTPNHHQQDKPSKLGNADDNSESQGPPQPSRLLAVQMTEVHEEERGASGGAGADGRDGEGERGKSGHAPGEREGRSDEEGGQGEEEGEDEWLKELEDARERERNLTKREKEFWLRAIYEGALWGATESRDERKMRQLFMRKKRRIDGDGWEREGRGGRGEEMGKGKGREGEGEGEDLKQKVREMGEGEKAGRGEGEDVDESSKAGREGLYSPPDLNRRICREFNELKSIYKDALGEEYRSFSYYKALTVIEKLPFRIRTAEDARNLPSIGSSLQDQIRELIYSSHIQRLKMFKSDPKVRLLALFGSIWGVGPKGAARLVESGFTSLEQLRTAAEAAGAGSGQLRPRPAAEPGSTGAAEISSRLQVAGGGAREEREAPESAEEAAEEGSGKGPLTRPQLICLRFHDDINRRIPRHEVAEMERLLQRVAAEVQPQISVICGGSYRRWRASSSDLDVIVTHADGSSHRGFLAHLLPRLKREGLVTEDLSVAVRNSEEDPEEGVDTYLGLCKYPGREQRHRIDIKVYPRHQYAFGLIAWTGNDVLNRRLRLLADTKGFRLDDHALVAKPDADSVFPKRLVCSTEREVFEFLGCPWLDPWERNL